MSAASPLEGGARAAVAIVGAELARPSGVTHFHTPSHASHAASGRSEERLAGRASSGPCDRNGTRDSREGGARGEKDLRFRALRDQWHGSWGYRARARRAAQQTTRNCRPATAGCSGTGGGQRLRPAAGIRKQAQRQFAATGRGPRRGSRVGVPVGPPPPVNNAGPHALRRLLKKPAT